MKRVFALVALSLIIVTTLCACNNKIEIKRESIDCRYTPPYDGIETNYVHKYDWWQGDFVLVPEVKTVHHDAVYEIKYRITYDDGSTKDIWETVTANEYNEYRSYNNAEVH